MRGPGGCRPIDESAGPIVDEEQRRLRVADAGTALEVVSENGEELTATVASLPFVDPQKKAPAGDLKAS